MDSQLNLTVSLRDRLSSPFASSKNKVLSGNKEMQSAFAQLGLKGEQSFDRINISHERAFSSMRSRMDSFRASASQGFGDMAMQMPGIGGLASMATPWVAAGAGIAALGQGVSKLITMSREWERGMAEVNLTAGLNPAQLDQLSGKIRGIAKDIPVDLEGAPQAFNKIISAGLSVNESLGALAPTLQASKAGFANMETVALAGTRVMKATGLDITTVYDKLFQVVRAGNATFQDVAQYMPRLIPESNALGVSFNDVSGAFATLTTSMSSEQSATSLQNIFTALGRSQIRANLKGIGVDVYDSAGKMRGFGDIIADLRTKLSGLSEEQKAIRLGNLGFDQEAFNGFAALTEKLGELNKNIGMVSDSQGSLNKAVKDTTTSADEETKAWNNLKAALGPVGDMFSSLKTSVFNSITKQATQSTSEGLKDYLALVTLGPLGSLLKSKNDSWDDKWAGIVEKDKQKQYAAQRRNEPIKQQTFGEYDLMRKQEIAPGLNMIALPKPAQSGFKLPSAMAIESKAMPLTKAELDYAEGKKGKDKSENNSPSTSIVGAAAQPKNITINIESFIKNFTISNQSTKNMSTDELQRYFIDMFMGVSRYAETQL